jgi:hypothetical protein
MLSSKLVNAIKTDKLSKDVEFSKPKTIAIDFDRTFTLDVETWTKTIELFKLAGWQVICISSRGESPENRKHLQKYLPNIPILLTNNSPKSIYSRENGYNVDVWVDDTPCSIPSTTEFTKYIENIK